MYQTFVYDQYNSYYYQPMNKSLDECHSPEFRARSQTWAGNEVNSQAFHQDISSSDQYTCCLDSLNSNEDSMNSLQNYSVNDKYDDKSEGHPKIGSTKKTSRKNPWGQETYADLIEDAISSFPTKMATLQQIYDHIAKHHKYFQDRSDATQSAGWKNSIRHNLSLHDKFLKCPKKNENMKSSLWSINHSCAKRLRSNSMDCKNNGKEISTRRRQLKEQRRSAASNLNIISEPKRPSTIRAANIDNVSRTDSFPLPFVSTEEEVLAEKSPEFLDLEPELKYMPPDIVSSTAIVPREYNLHEDLGRLGMKAMEPIYNYEDQYCGNYTGSEIPNFHLAAMEYSIFVAELFND